MRPSKIALTSFVGTFLFGALIPDAKALWERKSAADCQVYSSVSVNSGGFGYPHVIFLNNGLQNSSMQVGEDLLCPAPDDDRFPKQYINMLNLHVYDGNAHSDVSARVCVNYYGTNGGACGTAAYSGGAF